MGGFPQTLRNGVRNLGGVQQWKERRGCNSEGLRKERVVWLSWMGQETGQLLGDKYKYNLAPSTRQGNKYIDWGGPE